MMVVSLKPPTDSKTDPLVFRIELSDGSLFSFKVSYLSNIFPHYEEYLSGIAGREITGEEADSLRFAASCYRAERAAFRLIARAEQTGSGISRKLEQRGHAASCVRAVVTQLTALEILSDERYATLWLRSRLSRGAESPRSLVLALCRRGISMAAARRALKPALDFDTELALLRRYLAKKHPAHEISTTGNSFLRQTLRREEFSSPVLNYFWEENEG